ncbi:unnamed protein product [Nesidiocoris tenuis]|uniref:Rel homology dimerisation domain-containing protein n=1 Tax=Nesidiocoris tenuis TaxID=355587 RepID=A0A6H5FYA4_9HEMI|nr:unnamed protein product [Nesidiocoris tenuis]
MFFPSLKIRRFQRFFFILFINFYRNLILDLSRLFQSHLVCTIPPYKVEDLKETVVVKLVVVSSGRSSEAQTFLYTPMGTAPLQGIQFQSKEETSVHSVMLMPPPPAVLAQVRPPSQAMEGILEEHIELKLEEHIELKREVPSPPAETTAPDLCSSQTPSMATIRQFVSSSSQLPALSVENYLSKIENTALSSANQVMAQKFEPPGSLSRSEQIASLENQIAVSMANEAQVASKLEAFVKSSVESQLSPRNEVTPSFQTSTGDKLILESMGLVQQQSSPLNLNTHESMVTSSLSPQHLIPVEQKIHSPSPGGLGNLLSEAPTQSPSLGALTSQIHENSLVSEAANNLIINPNFSPGKKIMVDVADNVAINIADLSNSATSFDLPQSSASGVAANDLLMKVVDGMSQQPAYSSSPMIRSSLNNSPQGSQAPSIMVSPQFQTSQESIQDQINIPVVNYVSPQPLSVNSKDTIQNEMHAISNEAHFQNALLPTNCIAEVSPQNGSDANQTTAESGIRFNEAAGLMMDGHFPPSVMTTRLSMDGDVNSVKTLVTDVDSNFSNTLVYADSSKLPLDPSGSMNMQTAPIVSMSVDTKPPQYTPAPFSPTALSPGKMVATEVFSSQPNTLGLVKADGGTAEPRSCLSNAPAPSTSLSDTSFHHQDISRLVESFTSCQDASGAAQQPSRAQSPPPNYMNVPTSAESMVSGSSIIGGPPTSTPSSLPGQAPSAVDSKAPMPGSSSTAGFPAVKKWCSDHV